MTQPFTPIIYFGDELGMRGFKENYGSDANDIPFREPFKWDAVNNGTPMTNYWVLNNQAFTNAYSQNNDGRSVEEQLGVPGSLLETYRTLITTRTGSVALRRGAYTPITNSSGSVWAFLREHQDQTVLVVINLGGNSVNAALDLANATIGAGGTTPTSLIDAGTLAPITDANKNGYTIPLGAYGFDVYEVDMTVPEPEPGDVDGRDIPDDMGISSLRATQTTPTGFGDNLNELNQLFAKRSGGFLDVGITGNLETNGNGFCLFIDSDPGGSGGQKTLDLSNLSPPPSGPDQLTGLRFDDGFAPDWFLFVNTWSGNIFVDLVDLGVPGGAKRYVGQGLVNSGTGLLSGGSNPFGLEVAMDNTNTDGVTASSAAGAGTATTGFEMRLPLTDIALTGAPCEDLRIAAFLIAPDGNVSNQWLPALGPGQSTPGFSPDMRNVPGDQFASVVFASPADLTTTGAGAGDPGFGVPDGNVTGTDINYFVNAWVALDTNIADLTTQGAGVGDPGFGVPDGLVTAADISYYVNLWVAGCP